MLIWSLEMSIKHLNQIQLAERWNVSSRTLERWRWLGQGPVLNERLNPIPNHDLNERLNRGRNLAMAKSNNPNERVKRAYIYFLRQAMGRSEDSPEAVAAALHRFESYTGFRDFKDFRVEQAKGFKAHLVAST
jgi:hypothetical protein